ncbi:extracellular solute-binding protein [Sporolactobacillus sp. THM19-2]|jgi:arabinogalactan oligomer/maltooligosaccharide transport system substrate-binding protein|uniref:extracellular solute-binding protein n=1 Tax=Sporolactobacillus sp. THM19-2 TaxID=2511171 RepID=UPI0010215559|nr:extracellular solute-binding protein [Sporolactobacillus sp. THM19-2]RYL91488.1 extracellular solute-binding protein [Sporolactobacillus sp. THM19-2]
MKHIKKVISMLVIFGLIFTLAACGSGGSGESNGKKTLTVSIDPTYEKFAKDIIPKFEKANNVKVKLVKKPMFDQLEALPLDGPSGNGPDVMIGPYDRIGGLGQQGHLLELDKGILDPFDQKNKEMMNIGGKIYGVPFVNETLVMFYNKDLLSKAPKTFEELESLTKDPKYAFKSESGKSTAFLTKWTDFFFSYGLLSGYGAYVFGDNGTDREDIGLNNDGAVEAGKYAAHWFQDIWPKGMRDVKSSGDFVLKQFQDGKTAAIIDGPWQAVALKNAKVNYGVSLIPTLPNGKPYAPFAGGKGWIASAYTKQPELAQKWLTYVTNEKNSYKFFEATNEIPANVKTQEKVSQGSNELANAVIKQYQSSVPMPSIPEMAEVWPGMESTMFNIASGKKAPKKALDDAVKMIQTNIKQKYNQ